MTHMKFDTSHASAAALDERLTAEMTAALSAIRRQSPRGQLACTWRRTPDGRLACTWETAAAGAAVVASAAVDEAEQAWLEAWLARKDADSAQDTKPL